MKTADRVLTIHSLQWMSRSYIRSTIDPILASLILRFLENRGNIQIFYVLLLSIR